MKVTVPLWHYHQSIRLENKLFERCSNKRQQRMETATVAMRSTNGEYILFTDLFQNSFMFASIFFSFDLCSKWQKMSLGKKTTFYFAYMSSEMSAIVELNIESWLLSMTILVIRHGCAVCTVQNRHEILFRNSGMAIKTKWKQRYRVLMETTNWYIATTSVSAGFFTVTLRRRYYTCIKWHLERIACVALAASVRN